MAGNLCSTLFNQGYCMKNHCLMQVTFVIRKLRLILRHKKHNYTAFKCMKYQVTGPNKEKGLTGTLKWIFAFNVLMQMEDSLKGVI